MSSYSILKVNGVELPRPNELRVRPVGVTDDIDNGDWIAELIQGPGTSPIPALDQNAMIEIVRVGGDEILFRGDIVQAVPADGSSGWAWSYQCQGFSDRLNKFPIRNPNLSASYVFNQRTDDPEYSASLSGLTLGGMIVRLLDDHADNLSAAGVTYDAVDFAVLTQTPYTPIAVQGERFWNTIRSLLIRQAPAYRLRLAYDAIGCKLTLRNLNAPATTVPVVMGTSKVPRTGVRFSMDQVFTAHKIMGDAQVQPFELRLAATLDHEKIEETWTTTDANLWTYDDFRRTKDAASEGAVTGMTATTVTIDPDSAAQGWGANEWAGSAGGRLYLSGTPISAPGQEVTSQEARMVSANSALSPGGTGTVSVDVPFTQNTFTKYKLFRDSFPGSRSNVYRKYRVKSGVLRERLRAIFPRGEKYSDQSQSGAQVLTWTPMAFIVVNGIRYQVRVSVDPSEGTITFAEPIVAHTALGNSEFVLNTAGSTKVKPNDVVVFVPIAAQELSVRTPETGFAGTAYDWYGIESEHVTFLADWNDIEAKAQVQELCDQRHEVERDLRMDVALDIIGYDAHEWLNRDQAVLLSATMGDGGDAVDIGHWGDVPLTARRVSVTWTTEAGMVVTVSASNAKQPFADEDLFTHGVNNGPIANNFLNSPYLPTDYSFSMFGDSVAGTNITNGAIAVAMQQGMAASGVALQQAIGFQTGAIMQAMSNSSVMAAQRLGGYRPSQYYAGGGMDYRSGDQVANEYMQAMDDHDAQVDEEMEMYWQEADRLRREGKSKEAEELEGWIRGRRRKPWKADGKGLPAMEGYVPPGSGNLRIKYGGLTADEMRKRLEESGVTFGGEEEFREYMERWRR